MILSTAWGHAGGALEPGFFLIASCEGPRVREREGVCRFSRDCALDDWRFEKAWEEWVPIFDFTRVKHVEWKGAHADWERSNPAMGDRRAGLVEHRLVDLKWWGGGR